MPNPNGDGRHTAGGTADRRRRNALIVGVLVLALLAFGGGYLLAQNDGGTEASPTPIASRSPTPPEDASVTPSASASASGSASASVSASPVLEDGRHFVYPKEAAAEATWSLTFDLAYFYSDQDAVDECGPDVPNGYCIVNDNPKLRTLPVAQSVVVRYIPVNACCELKPGNFPALAEAVNGTAQTDYESDAPYWITVQAGQIVRVVQQFLP
jgi:hypothetical protein